MRVTVALRHKYTSSIPDETFNNSMNDESTMAGEKHDVPTFNLIRRNFAEDGNVARAHPGQHAGALHAQPNTPIPRQTLDDLLGAHLFIISPAGECFDIP